MKLGRCISSFSPHCLSWKELALKVGLFNCLSLCKPYVSLRSHHNQSVLSVLFSILWGWNNIPGLVMCTYIMHSHKYLLLLRPTYRAICVLYTLRLAVRSRGQLLLVGLHCIQDCFICLILIFLNPDWCSASNGPLAQLRYISCFQLSILWTIDCHINYYHRMIVEINIHIIKTSE